MMKKKFKVIYVEITNRCNLDCPFCLPSKREHRDLSPSDFRTILHKIKPYTDYLYLHLKGEPLCHPDFIRILSIAAECGFKVNLTTNGTLIDKFGRELLKNPAIHRINLSLQAMISYHRADYLSNLKAFLQMHQEKPTKIISLRMWNNEDELNVLKNNQLINDLIGELKEDIDSVKISDNLFLSVANEFTWPSIMHPINHHQASCLGGKTHLGILNNGDIVLCCLDQDGHTKLGNIFIDEMDDVLQSHDYLQAVKGFNNRSAYFELCQKCTFRDRFL